jgi:hypothetical protein
MKRLPTFVVCSLLSALPNAQAAAAAPTEFPTTSYKADAQSVALGVAIALPVVATGVTIAKHDRAGAAELLVGSFLSVTTAYALNNIVREERPDGSSYHSFPAETSALAASSSSYLWGRYGWQYGIPAYAASDLVSLSLAQAKKARWYDTLASSAIATGYSLAVTRRFRSRYNLTTRLSATPSGGFVSFAFGW